MRRQVRGSGVIPCSWDNERFYRAATRHRPPSWTVIEAPPALVAKRFLPVTRTTVEFALVVGSDRFRFVTWGESVAKGAVPVPYEELPKALREPPPVPRGL